MMNPLSGLGKTLVFVGIIITAAGILMVLSPRIPWLGKLPGDIVIKRENFSFYFPVATCVIISLLLSLIFYLFKK